jgi:hypothetical protein
MATRIDFLEHGGKGHYEYNSIVCGYCSSPPKEVLRGLARKFQVASYRDRSLRPGIPYHLPKSIAIYDIDSNEFDTKKEFFNQGWRIIKPEIIGISIKPLSSVDQLLKEVEKEIGRWRYDDFYIISPARQLKAMGCRSNHIEYMMKSDKRTFSFSKLAKDYMKTIVEKTTWFNQKDDVREDKKVPLSTIVNMLLDDEPLKEMCEIFLREDDLERKMLKKYILDNGLYKNR